MALSQQEQEELEFLELERERASSGENLLSSQPEPQEQPAKGILGKIGSNLSNRWDRSYNNAIQLDNKQITGPEYQLRQVGNSLGVIGDVVNPLVEPVIQKGIELYAKSPLGKPTKSALTAAKVPEALGYVKNKANEFEQAHPRATEDIKGVLDIVTNLPIGTLGAIGAKKSAEAVAKPLGKGLEDTALRMQNSRLKILSKEANEGAKIENVPKYDLWGKPEQVQAKAQSQIEDLAKQLKDKISSASANPETNVNIPDLIEKAKIRALESTSFGRGKVKTEVDQIMNDLVDKYGEDGLKAMNLADAQLLKRETGKFGDWYASPKGGMAVSEDANIKAQVYNTLYDELKREIENKGPEGIKELNKQLSELIPLERAASKRMLVSKRNEVIPLKEYVGGLATLAGAASGNLAPLALVGAQIASKNTKLAKGLYGLGKKMQGEAKPIEKISDRVAPKPFTPITDEARMLPAPMLGEGELNVQKMLPSLGDRIRAIGTGEVPRNTLSPEFMLPSPEDIKRLYPNLTDEDIRTIIFKLNEQRLLPAPMVDNQIKKQVIQAPFPSRNDKISSIGKRLGGL